MRIVIIGGAHFPAINICLSLAQKYPKYQFFILDSTIDLGTDLKSTLTANPQISLWEGTAENKTLLKNLLSNADILINFLRAEEIENYIGQVSYLFEYAKASHLERIIHISSSKVYGEVEDSPVTEGHPLKPVELKGVLESFGENLAYYYSREYDLPVTVLRAFTVYGPYQPLSETIPFLITNAFTDKPLPLWEEGEWTENLLFVEDFTEAINKVLKVDFDSLRGEVINIGGLGGFTIKKIADIILTKLKKPQNLIEYRERYKQNPTSLIPSVMKAKILLSWTPKVDIEDGIQRMIDWYINNKSWWEEKE